MSIVEINDTTNTGVMSYEEAKAYAKGKRRSSTNYKTYDVEKQGGDMDCKHIYNEQGECIGCIYREDPTDPRSYKYIYNEQGKCIGCIYGEDPTNPRSYKYICNEQGECIECIYGDDPTKV